MAISSACSSEEPATPRDATVSALDASDGSSSLADATTSDASDTNLVDAGAAEDIGLLDSAR